MGLAARRDARRHRYLTHADCPHSLQYIASDRWRSTTWRSRPTTVPRWTRSRPGSAPRASRLLSDTPQEHGLAARHSLRRAGRPRDRGVRRNGSRRVRSIPAPASQPRQVRPSDAELRDTGETVRLLIETLGFRLSDDVRDGYPGVPALQPRHHGVGVARGPRTGLNHYAWEVETSGRSVSSVTFSPATAGASSGDRAATERSEHLHLPLRSRAGDRRVRCRPVSGLGRGDL